MLIEVSRLIDLPVVDSRLEKVGQTASAIFNGQSTRLAGFEIKTAGLTKKTRGLFLEDTIQLSLEKITIDQASRLTADTKPLEALTKQYGTVIGVTAKTESGKRIGKIHDVIIEAETGIIVRFYLRNLLKEQLIPRQFLVSVTPSQIVFKDIVDQPVFDQAASLEIATPSL